MVVSKTRTRSSKKNSVDAAIANLRHPSSTLQAIRDLTLLTQEEVIDSYEPLLPLALRIQGQPYTLKDYEPFSPMYRMRPPRQLLMKTGRQCAKSTNLAGSTMMSSYAIPFFRTLHIAPLFEQIRRFSSNVMRPFVETSPLRNLWRDATIAGSVLQRSFNNQSTVIFSFANTDAERIRGVSCDAMVIDESCWENALVKTPAGDTMIKDLITGDKIYGVTEDGKTVIDTVVTNSDHGVRMCFEFTFSDGTSVPLTSESYFATTIGWRRVSSIIEELVGAAGADAAGYDAGGRAHECTGDSEPQIPVQSQLDAARLQRRQIPGVRTVCFASTRKKEERRLRGMVELLGDQDLSGISPYRFIVPTPRPETGDQDLAQTAQLGGDSVLVHGRRSSGRDKRVFSHGRIFRERELADCFLFDGEGHNCQSQAIFGEQWESVLVHSMHGQGHQEVDLQDQAVYSRVDAVQTGYTGNCGPLTQLRLLRGKLRQKKLSIRRTSLQAVLSGPRVSVQAEGRDYNKIHIATRQTRTAQRKGSSAVSQQSRSRTGTLSGFSEAVSRTASRQSVSRQEKTNRQRAASQTGSLVDLPEVPTNRAARRPGNYYSILRRLSKNSQARTIAGFQRIAKISSTGHHSRYSKNVLTLRSGVSPCRQQSTLLWERLPEKSRQHSSEGEIRSIEITAIKFAGYLPVRDITTANTRTFAVGGGVGVVVHNCQNFDSALLPIIESCMAASKYKIAKFCGTPKSKENTIEGFWQKSSQAEWVIKCQTGGCGKWNIPHIDHHLLKMIGPPHQHISERYPGTVCYSCQKPISPRYGHWLHAVPERRMTFAGYHVPQIILPMHFASHDDWTILHAKLNGAGNTSHAKFCNEILGESVDVGQKLVSMTELKKAGRLPWVNNPNNPDRQIYDRLDEYEHRVLGVDWGGGGDEAMSYTVFTLLGYKPGGRIDVLWGKRLPSSQEHLKEGAELKFWMERFRAHYIAHDYTGAGTVRETLIRQAGIPADRILSMQYVPAMAGNLIKYIQASPVHTRPFYRLNKARSLLYTCNAIKFDMIDFFQWDGTGEANEGLMQDFLALTENKIETRVGDMYTIGRNPLLIDDFSHAVNFGCAALWHMHDSWPDLSRVITMKDIDDQMQALIGDEHSWDNYKDEDDQSNYVEVYR